jgi:S1-C subfamily serine protease
VNSLDLLAIALLVAGILLGWRSGALPQVGGLIGALLGAWAGITVIPLLLPHLDTVVVALRAGVILVVLVLAIGAGEMVGARVGRMGSNVLGEGLLGALDRVAGGIVGAGQAVLIVWLIGGILTTGILPSLVRSAQTSTAIRGLDAVLPPPTELVLQLGKALDKSGLPDVFLGLERLPAPPVDLPSKSIATALGKAALASIPRVEAIACDYRSTGTGIVVRNGYVLTNAHVIAGAREIQVVTAAGAFSAILVFMDPELDVALLRVRDLVAAPLRFATSVPGVGSIGATVGYPDGGSVVIGPAGVTAIYVAEGLDISGSKRVRREIVELRAVVDPGDSGGPLLLADGTVGALVFAESKTDPNVGYALSPTDVAVAVTPFLGRIAPVSSGPCLH